MNRVFLKGNLTRDPEIREVGNGDRKTNVVTFAIAINRFFKRSDGTKDKDTTYVECEAWDSGAKTINEIFNKGDSILVEGSLKVDNWKDKDDNKRTTTRVRVSTFEKLNYKKKSDDQKSEAQPAAASDAGDGDDIPF